MIEIDYKNRDPIYLQIVQSIMQLIMLGNLQEGDQLPAVRQLAVELGINPNTVQKAYRELEREGIIYSVAGKGSFVEGAKHVDAEIRKQFYERLEEIIKESFSYGIRENEIQAAVEEILKRLKDEGSE